MRLTHEWKVNTVWGRSVRVWRHWLKLLVENSQSAKEIHTHHNYAYTRLQQTLSQDSSRTSMGSGIYPWGPVPYPLCPVPGYDIGKVQKLDLYDYLTLFQYLCCTVYTVRIAYRVILKVDLIYLCLIGWKIRKIEKENFPISYLLSDIW